MSASPTPTPPTSPTSPAYGAKRLVWIDLETTGLDPKGDQILEVACVITDSELNEIEGTRREWIVTPALLVRVDLYVLAMHVKNGLFEAISNGRGRAIRVVMDELRDLISAHTEEGKALIAGSTPQFDKAFILENSPAVYDHFNHRVFDVSTLKAAARMWGGYPEKDPMPTAHRALADVLYSIGEAKEIRARYFAPPSATETYTTEEVFGPDPHAYLPDPYAPSPRAG